MEHCRNAKGCFTTGGRSVQSGTIDCSRFILRHKPNMNVKTTIKLLDVSLKRCFITFPFILRGAFGSERVQLDAQGVPAHPQNP